MLTSYDSLGARGLSGKLWSGFAPPVGNQFLTYGSGNPAFGVFDDFTSFHASTLEGPYIILEGTNATVEQTASTYDPDSISTTALGILRFALTGAGSGAANEEAGIAWGRGLDAPFYLGSARDLAFECRFSASETTASKWAYFLGLAEVGACVTDKVFVDSTGVFATDYDFLGFQHLYAESTAVDAMYAVDGDNVDGADNTGLDTVATMVALTYKKLGFRYRAQTGTLHWYVDGVEDKGARLVLRNLTSGTFPDDNYMTPTFVFKDIAGDDSVNFHLDWLACAQAL